MMVCPLYEFLYKITYLLYINLAAKPKSEMLL